MFGKRILDVYSVIVGLFLIISGIGKAMDTAAFSNLIYLYGLGYLMRLSPLIAVTEILIGLFLFLLINPKRYSSFSFFLVSIFTIAFAYAHFEHGVNDCGCLGTLQHSNFPPILTFIRNFILLVMSLAVWIKYPKGYSYTPKWKTVVVLLAMFPSVFMSGFTFRMPSILKNNSEMHKYLNESIKNTELSKYIRTSPDSTYLIFCFSYACPHCWNSIENLRQFKKSNTVDSVVALATGGISDRLFFIKNFHPDFSIKDLPLNAMSKMVEGFPTAFYVAHDTIKVIMQSELPSAITFKEYNLPNSK